MSDMLIINEIVAQGDILITRIDRLPEGLKKADNTVVAHSETGHHHIARPNLRDCEVELYPQDQFKAFLKISRKGSDLKAQAESASSAIDQALASNEAIVGARIDHERPYDTHQTVGLTLRPGESEAYFQISRQREMGLEGWRRVQD